MLAQAVSYEQHADEDQEAEREDLERWMPANEIANGAGEKQHDRDREHDSGAHDPDRANRYAANLHSLVDGADGRNDRVERKNDVHDSDRHNYSREALGRSRRPIVPFGAAIDLVVNFDRALVDQKQTANDQDEIANGDVLRFSGVKKGHPGQNEDWFLQAQNERERREQEQARHECGTKTNLPTSWLLTRAPPPGQDGNEDDVVDPKDDFEGRQRYQRDEDF